MNFLRQWQTLSLMFDRKGYWPIEPLFLIKELNPDHALSILTVSQPVNGPLRFDEWLLIRYYPDR